MRLEDSRQDSKINLEDWNYTTSIKMGRKKSINQYEIVIAKLSKKLEQNKENVEKNLKKWKKTWKCAITTQYEK